MGLYEERYWTHRSLELENGIWRRLPPAPPDMGAGMAAPRDWIELLGMPVAKAHAILERWREAGIYIQWGEIDQGWAVPGACPEELAAADRRWRRLRVVS